MEINNSDNITVDCLRRSLRQVWRFFCCCGSANYEIQLSVEETAPHARQSTVLPWFEECNDEQTYLSHQFRRRDP